MPRAGTTETVQIVSKDARVLVVATAQEAAPTCDVLAQASLPALACPNAATLRELLREAAGAVLLTEAALGAETLEVLNAALASQPDWSDLPLLYLQGSSKSSAEQVTETLQRRVFVLEPPHHAAALLSAVRLALAAREQQYRVRDLSAQLEASAQDSGRRAEKQTAELHLSEVRFSKVFDASPVPVTITTLSEDRYLEANESALELLGFGREEVIGRKVSELSRGEQMTGKTRDDFFRSLQEEGTRRDLPIKFRTKTGEPRDGLATFEIIEFAGELCLLSLVLDVTERRRDEAELMQAVKEVMNDADWFSRSFVEKLAQVKARAANPEERPSHQTEIKDLTPREQQILERVAQGHNNAQIADELELSKHTVRNYLANVFEKLNVHTRAEAMVWARERGLGRGSPPDSQRYKGRKPAN